MPKKKKKIGPGSYFYHEYFVNILYFFFNKTGNLTPLTTKNGLKYKKLAGTQAEMKYSFKFQRIFLLSLSR